MSGNKKLKKELKLVFNNWIEEGLSREHFVKKRSVYDLLKTLKKTKLFDELIDEVFDNE